MDLAHETVTRSEIWGAWGFDPLALAALVAAGWLYARGIIRLWGARGPRAVRPRHVAAFYVGLTLVTIALVSPLDALAGALVSAHMAQHLVFLVVAPPLIVYAAPGLVMSSALPRSIHRSLNRARRPLALVSGVAVAVVVHAVVMWIWHLPAPYEAAIANEWLHMLEHASFFGSALLFWGAVVEPRARRRVPYPAAIAGAVTIWILSGGLGALLSFATRPLYPVMAHDAARWGAGALADQQLAGVLMWVPAGFTYLVAIAVLFVRWMDSMERRMQRAQAMEVGR
ncbi:MAG TPA: cytochrome c oxidase assembly protein [Actinomycetota bacterium]